MEIFPTEEKKLKARISAYKSALKREKAKFGCYSDGSGKRYSLFVLFFALGDLRKLEEYMDFFQENFPDDMGEPGQQFCWALGLNRMGRDAKAEFRLAELMLSNLYLIPQILKREIEEYDMWHSSNWQHIDYIEYIPTELIDTFTEEDLAWAEEKYDSFQFAGIRKQHIELYAALDKTKGVEERGKILKKARTLLKPLERNAANKLVQRT